MMTRNKAVKAGHKTHSGIKTVTAELRRFCLDLQKLVSGGGDPHTHEISPNQAINTPARHRGIVF